MSEHRWSPYRPPGPFVRPVRIDPEGRLGPTTGQARGPRWVRTGPGYYVPADVDRSRAEQRIVEATLPMPAGAALTGWAALRMFGGAFFDGLDTDGRSPLPVCIRVPSGTHRRDRTGVRFIQGGLPGVVMIRQLPCASLRAALLDEMRLATDPREAVVAMDMTAAAELMSIARMQRFVGHRSWRGVPGIPQARWALGLAVETSRSPQETRLRLVWILDARMGRPLVNPPLFDLRGELLGYPDLFDPTIGLVAEYDGADHRAARRHSEDVDREDTFRRAGLEVTRVTSADLGRREHLVTRLHRARERAMANSGRRKTWTLAQPPWFQPRPPVDTVLDIVGAAR